MPAGQNGLTAVLGPVTGSGSRTLTVTASRSMSLTMGCIGTGMLTVSGRLNGAGFCGSAGNSGSTFWGYYWAHVSARPGELIKLRIAADAKSMWDIRIDGSSRQ
jgi:hypothetical protein